MVVLWSSIGGINFFFFALCAGVTHLIKAGMIKEGAAVIDVGEFGI